MVRRLWFGMPVDHRPELWQRYAWHTNQARIHPGARESLRMNGVLPRLREGVEQVAFLLL